MITPVLIIVVVSYLLGSIPFGYLLVRVFRGQDVRKTGSGNIGATNVARTGSKGLAITTLLLDALKGYAAVTLAFHLSGVPGAFFRPGPTVTLADTSSVSGALQTAYLAAALAGFFAMIGHMFPVWLGFKGGKGVATAVGVFLAIAPRPLLLMLLLFVLVVAITRYVSLGSILAAVLFPFACWWLNQLTRTWGSMLLIGASSLLIIVRHKDNIRRLLAGTENRFR